MCGPPWRKRETPGRSLFDIIVDEVNLSKMPAGLDNRDLNQGPPGRPGGLVFGGVGAPALQDGHRVHRGTGPAHHPQRVHRQHELVPPFLAAGFGQRLE